MERICEFPDPYSMYEEPLNIQIQGASVDEVEIEVFDISRDQRADIFSMSEMERERLLLVDFDNDVEVMRRISDVIARAAHIRALLHPHKNPDLMARQIAIIGQDPQLFPSRLIIPHLQISPTFADFIARLQATNAQQIVRGRVVRTRIARRTQNRELANSQKMFARAKEPTRATSSNEVQFPSRIICKITNSRDSRTTFIGATSSEVPYIIQSLSTAPISRFPFARISKSRALYDAPSAPTSTPYWHPFYHKDITITMEDARTDDKQIALRSLYTHIVLVYRQFICARPYFTPSDFEHIAQPAQSAQSIEVLPESLVLLASRITPIMQSIGFATSFAFTTNQWCTFFAHGILPIYQIAAFTDIPIESISAKFRAYIASLRRAQLDYATYYRERARIQVLARIIEIRLKERGKVAHSFRGLRAVSDERQIVSEEELMRDLSASDVRFVRAEYENLMRVTGENISRTVANCAHNSIVAQLRASTSIAAISSALTALARFIPTESKSNGAFLRCAICRGPLICPHTLRQSQAIIARETPASLRTIMTQYIEKIPEREISYCKICAEVFDEDIVTNDDVEHVSIENEDLADAIFHELIVIQKYIRATRVIDQIAFFRMVMRHIYPPIELVNNHLMVAQTSAAAELAAKMRVFIAIYVFADCIVNMDRFGIIFDKFSAPAAHKTAALIKYSVDKITIINNIALNIIPGFTREVISSNLITAIGRLRTVSDDMPFEQPTDYRAILQYDPIFALIFHECLLSAHPKLDHSVPFTFRETIFDILEPEAHNPLNVYEELFAQCKQQTSSRNSHILREMRDIYAQREFAYPIQSENAQIVKLRASIAARRAKSRTHYDILRAALVPTLSFLKSSRDSDIFDYRALIPINLVYDAQGFPHDWTIFLVSHADGSVSEEKMTASGIFIPSDTHIIGKKCAKCGAKTTDARATAEQLSAISQAVLDRDNTSNFYQFYEDRCPEGGSHTYKGGAKICAKCGFAQHEDAQYFAKYSRLFIETYFNRATNNSTDNDIVFNTRKPFAAEEDIARKIIAEPWSFNYEILITSASAFGVEKRDILMLGARSGLTRAELSDESFVARVPKTRDDPRIQYLRSRITDIIVYYQAMRGIASREKITITSVATFIEELRKTRGSKFEEECTALPNLDATIFAPQFPSCFAIVQKLRPSAQHAVTIAQFAVAQFVTTRKPAEIIEFCLEIICAFLLALHERGDLASAFARALLVKFIRIDNLTLKEEFYNATIVEGTKLISDISAIHIEQDSQDPEEDVTQDDEDTDDPFSLNSFDLDDDVRDEDDDDAGPVMRMGNEIGW